MASDLARHGRRGDRAALAAASLLLVLHALSYLGWTEDDAGVSLRYAVNLVEGQGLVYNPGERVEAISNLGLVLLLAPIYALLPGPDARLHLLLAAKLLGLVAATLGLFEARRLARISALGRLATFAALVLVAGSGPYAAWAVGALEVPFVAWASAALVAAAAEIAAGDSSPGRGPVRRAQLAALALVLLRVDGFVLPAAILATLWLLRRPLALLLRLAAPATALLVLVFLGRLLYYGEWWPNPVLAKVELQRRRRRRSTPRPAPSGRPAGAAAGYGQASEWRVASAPKLPPQPFLAQTRLAAAVPQRSRHAMPREAGHATLQGVRLEWDEAKRLCNLERHALDFRDAWRVFSLPILAALDDREDYREDRWLGIGFLDPIVVVIAFTGRRHHSHHLNAQGTDARARTV